MTTSCLLCGDVKGNFNVLFNRVEKLNKKLGPFEFLFCAGDFFGDNYENFLPYKNGSKKVPITTFILGPVYKRQEQFYEDLNGTTLCENLEYLGKRGMYITSNGIKIVYVSGKESNSDEDCKFYETDIKNLRDNCLKKTQNFKGVDLLITTQWPKNITNLDNSYKQKYDGSTMLAWLAAQISPRYHIVSNENTFYERKPYRNESKQLSNVEIATRFLSLATVGDKTQRWLYALNLTPIDKMSMKDLNEKTIDETSFPFDTWTLNDNLNDKKVNQQFFYDMDTNNVDGKKRKRKQNNEERKKFMQDNCWFCLGSENVEKHLVISIATSTYLAMAKGGLVPDNLLILPIEHYQSLRACPLDVLNEIDKFKMALKRYFKKFKKVPIFFERNYKTAHLQVQVIPVPERAATNLKDIFQFEADGHGFQLNQMPEDKDLKEVISENTPYFLLELPNDTLYTICNKNFPLQFGREVLASEPVLNLPERIEWQDCKMSKEEEIEICQNVRKLFSPFDFTVED